MKRFWHHHGSRIALFVLIIIPKPCVFAQTMDAALSLPFEKTVVFEGQVPGEFKDSIINNGKIDEGIATFQRSGKADLVIPWNKVKAILPIYPENAAELSIKDLREALGMLQANQKVWSMRPEVSEGMLLKWRERIDGILRHQQDVQIKRHQEEEDMVRAAAYEKMKAETATKEAEKARQIDFARRQVDNYLGFHTRQEIEDAVKACDKLDKSDLAKILDYEKASTYWKRCLALPTDTAMPGNLEIQNDQTMSLPINPSSSGSMITTLAWALLLVPIVVILRGLSRFLELLQERKWFGTGIWFGISSVAGTIWFLLFFSGHKNLAEATNWDTSEMRVVWAALANAKEKKVTRFAEEIKVPSKILIHQIVGGMKNPDAGSTAWVPTLTELPEVGGDSEVQIRVEVPLKWISLPVWISFATPLPDQEISLKATRGKIGTLSVGAGGGAWIWEQISPAYLGVVNALGLDQGVRLMMLKSGELAVSIPEVRAKIKVNP